jgi:cellulose synthase/poly-beta-1,6-N-acetylglucosamine synthase-like glycosyltransferase
MNAVAALWLGITTLLSLPVGVFWLQVIAARRSEQRTTSAPQQRPRVAVLIPAHNEKLGISATLRALRPQLRDTDRLLVVADNCSDDTASIARAEGAEAIERSHAELRGKGYALDFGVRHLERSAVPPPDVLVMVDADCIVHEGSIDRLVAQCQATGRPAQALYLMEAPRDAGLGMRIGQLAWRVKNEVRPRGWSRLGGPCQLMGTGMAFPWEHIRRAPLASGHLVEDMQLGVDLALAGHAPLFAPQALVTSRFPDTESAAGSQRRRWEHGHLATLTAFGPRLLWSGLTRGRWSAAALAVDLMVPPLALLMMLQVMLAVFNLLVSGAWLGVWAPAAVSIVALVLLAWAVVQAWSGFGRDIVTPQELASAPLYALRKLPLYTGFLAKRQAEWVRAKRDGE